MPYNNNGYNNNRYRNNNSRSGNQKPQESTNGPLLTNEHMGKFIEFSYWSNFAQINLGTVPAGMELDWNARRNAQTTKINMTFSDLSDVLDIIDDVIESIKNSGTFSNAAVVVGTKRDAMLEINNGSTIGAPPGIHLVIYKNMDTGRRPGQMDSYPFRDTMVLKDYDPRSGQAKEESVKLGQFKKFRHLIEESCKAFTLAQAHAIKQESIPKRLLQFKALAALTAALNVDMSAELNAAYASGGNRGGYGGGHGGNGGNNNYGRNNPVFGGNYGPPAQSTLPGNAGGSVLASVDDPVDINISMQDIINTPLPQLT